MDVALSRPGSGCCGLLRARRRFLYAPIVILLIFSFNNSEVPSFPLSGFTLHWYRQFLANGELHSALETSAIVAALSSLGAVVLGILASIALDPPALPGKAGVSALLLSPLVIPYVVFGVSLLLLFHTLGIPRSILTVVIGHIVITLPYTILVLVPRLQQIDVSLEEAAFDLGASRLQDVPVDHAPADPARGRLRVPDRVHDLVRRVRGRVVRRRLADDVPDLPLLRAALPQPAAAGDRGRRGGHRHLARRRGRRRGGPPRLRASRRGRET